MFKTLQNAFKIKDIRKKLFYTFVMLIVVRLGSQIPVPGTNASVIRSIMEQNSDAFSFLNAITGGSFEAFSIFGLSITPYITASIIMQLLTFAIPALEDLQQDGGEDGRKKIAAITRYVTIGLSLFEAVMMSISFGNQGLMGSSYHWYNVVVVTLVLTAGSAMLMWIGEQITEKGVGNGISIVLLINIVSRVPQDVISLYQKFMAGKSPAKAILAAVIIVAVVAVMVVLVIILQDGTRKIPVQYSKKTVGRRVVGAQSSNIPLKINTAGVIPVIFASSIMSIPAIIGQFVKNKPVWVNHLLCTLSSGYWFRTSSRWFYHLGYILYVALVIMFAYYYTSLTFNPAEVSENIKRGGGFIPGVRPGKPTADYLDRILNYLVFMGAVGLVIVCTIPMVISGVFNMGSISLGGTSIIIIVGVVLETIQQIESQMLVRNYKGFLNK